MDVLIKLYNYMQKIAGGRYKVNVPWIPGQKLADTNEMQSRERLQRVGKRLARDLKLEEEYGKMEAAKKESRGVIEKATYHLTGVFLFCMHATQRICSYYKGQDGV